MVDRGLEDRWLARRAAAYSVRNRQRKADLIRGLMADRGVTTVLLVGAEDATFAWSNIIERSLLDSGAWVVATGLGPKIELDTPRALADGRRLPFKDKCFDLVLSNAVIEHVGDQVDQQAFVDEHHRVGRQFILTTPNLTFPVESHLRVLFRHWSPRFRDRYPDTFTRLLSKRTLRALLPAGTEINGNAWSPTLVSVHSCDRDD